jgi:hypothetical protein
MSEDSATLDAPPPDATHSVQPRAAEANNTEFITRRVLLHEVLFEEYETHRPFNADQANSEIATMVASLLGVPDLNYVTQPQLDKGAVEALGAGSARAATGDGDEESEDERNARRVSGFFTLMAEAQQREAQRLDNLISPHIERIESIFERARPEGWSHTPQGEELDWLAETLTAHEVHGFIDDLREQPRKALAHIEDGAERAAEIERRAPESWLVSVGVADAASGHGQRASQTQEKKETASDVVAAPTDLMEALSHATDVAAKDEPSATKSSDDAVEKKDDDLLEGGA